MSKVLVTGAAGFIGFHLAVRLLEERYKVIGLDNLNNYYDVGLKRSRLQRLKEWPNFHFWELNIADRDDVSNMFNVENPEVVVHMAAQAGVRYSLNNPHLYVDSNLAGFINILEGCRHFNVKHLLFASSSSVYGLNTKMPYSVHDNIDHPISLYGATKKANELMAHSYSYLFGLPVTGLRFFTVYGPWGRPDMAYFLFTKAILSGEPINLFNNGKMKRDFTYIDDIIEGVARVIQNVPVSNPNWSGDAPDPGSSIAPYRIYNIGNNKPIELLRFIEILEECLAEKADKVFLPMQPGDVPETYADTDDLLQDVGFRPHTPVEEGVKLFVDWYKKYYSLVGARGLR